MSQQSEIEIRAVRISDLNKLKDFFIKSYGKNTVFQNEQFLLYYFKTQNKNLDPLSYSLIGVNINGEIVSHYGGQHYKLKLNKNIISLIWGVNAYTLPEWRGKGINSKIVNYIHENNEANAVIGMPFEAPFFYKNFGYNIFNKETLNRFIYILNNKALDIACELNNNNEKANKLLKIKVTDSVKYDEKKIVKLSKNNFNNFTIDFDIDNELVATTYRDTNFLNWRIFDNPYIKYKVYGYIIDTKIVSYIVIRQEILLPSNYKVDRIIDLFGNKEGVVSLLNYTIKNSFIDNSIYIDFSVYGKYYEKELITTGFDKLENDDVCILPMVTSPIENRPNHEFIVIQSKNYNDEINKLSSENVYFTRIDADRDRIAHIKQIK